LMCGFDLCMASGPMRAIPPQLICFILPVYDGTMKKHVYSVNGVLTKRKRAFLIFFDFFALLRVLC
jgi:hypothetical protein